MAAGLLESPLASLNKMAASFAIFPVLAVYAHRTASARSTLGTHLIVMTPIDVHHIAVLSWVIISNLEWDLPLEFIPTRRMSVVRHQNGRSMSLGMNKKPARSDGMTAVCTSKDLQL
eukprot:TRINITY_DN18501_c0_g2_i1.p2 TRINITY_DN18501_c0_g2~~TRINITY_DN18501_c0_g2_i1.p2  ORF type:complete len:117 (-),score=7.75 TRINITY_DN18501_c0_g2_i1:265-615(-)